MPIILLHGVVYSEKYEEQNLKEHQTRACKCQEPILETDYDRLNLKKPLEYNMAGSTTPNHGERRLKGVEQSVIFVCVRDDE